MTNKNINLITQQFLLIRKLEIRRCVKFRGKYIDLKPAVKFNLQTPSEASDFPHFRLNRSLRI
jgi:hypothetical protein